MAFKRQSGQGMGLHARHAWVAKREALLACAVVTVVQLAQISIVGGAWPRMYQQSRSAGANSNSTNARDFRPCYPSNICAHLGVGGLWRLVSKPPRRPLCWAPQATTGVGCCHNQPLTLRGGEFPLLLHSTVQSSCKFSQGSTESMEMTKSPIQRLMYNLLPGVVPPRVLKTILFIESLSGFLTVCMQQGHLVCPGCGIQAQPSQSQNQEGSYPPSTPWFTFPVKSLQSLAKMAVLLQQTFPRIQEPSLLSKAHVHSGQGPPEWYITGKAAQSVQGSISSWHRMQNAYGSRQTEVSQSLHLSGDILH